MDDLAQSLSDKSALVQRLQDALAALESGDEAAWRQEIDALAALRTQPMMAGLGRLARELGQALGELPSVPSEAGQDEILDRIRHNLTEVALTQSYQDLTGQIIRRVVGIVRRVHEGFGALGLPPPEDPARNSGLAGPAVDGLDRHAVSQHDADDLLSDLGL